MTLALIVGEKGYEDLGELSGQIHLTVKDFFNLALTTVHSHIEHHNQGDKVVHLDPRHNTYREIEIPGFFCPDGNAIPGTTDAPASIFELNQIGASRLRNLAEALELQPYQVGNIGIAFLRGHMQAYSVGKEVGYVNEREEPQYTTLRIPQLEILWPFSSHPVGYLRSHAALSLKTILGNT